MGSDFGVFHCGREHKYGRKALGWIKISNTFFVALYVLFYTLLLSGYLSLLSRKFVKKRLPVAET